MNNLGKRIKEKRKELGLTQKDISKKTNVSNGFISEIEHERYMPNGTILLELSKLLNCSVDWLLTGKEYHVPPANMSENLQEILNMLYPLDIQNQKDISYLIRKLLELPENQRKEITSFIDFKLSENKRKKDSGESNRQDSA